VINILPYHSLTISFLQHDDIPCYTEHCNNYDTSLHLSVHPSIHMHCANAASFISTFHLNLYLKTSLCLIFSTLTYLFTAYSTLQDIRLSIHRSGVGIASARGRTLQLKRHIIIQLKCTLGHGAL